MDLTEVSELIRTDLAAGRGTRATLGSASAVFGVGELPPTLADFSVQADCTSMTFDATTVSATGTPAKKTAEAAAKPNAVQLATAPVPLAKYSALAQLTLERQISSEGIASAIYQAMGGQAMLAWEADAYAAVSAAAADSTATTFLGGIAAAQGILLSRGAKPGLVIVPAGVYPELIGEVVGGPGIGSDPRSSVGTVLGSLIHVSSATGTEVIVADPAALLAVRHVDSPLVITDPYTLADTNQIRLVIDLVATFVVGNAAGVSGFTVTAAE